MGNGGRRAEWCFQPTVPETFWAQAAGREMLMLEKGFVEIQNVSETLLDIRWDIYLL